MAQKMAAANPLEELFNKDVDETALSALVGSLESQLASPTLKDPPQHSSAGAVHSNHVDAARVGDAISQHSQVLSQAGQKAGLVHNNAQISVNTVNGRKDSISQSQLINLNSVASSSPGLNNSTSGVSLQQRSHQGSPLTSAAHATSGNVVSSNVTNSTIPQTQINSNASQPPHLNSDHRTVVTIPGSTNTGTIVSGVPAPGHPSQVGGSAIYNLASVAAEQSPISISNHNSNNQSHIVTGARTTVREQLESKGQNDGVSVNMVNASNFNNKSQFIVKQDNIKPNSPQPIGVSNQQTINIVTGSKAAGTPPPASGGTVNKPVGNPQVTVVRPPTSNIQIVSVNSNNPRQPNSVGLPSHKTLAPRIVSAAPVRIGQPPASATQQTTQVMTAVPRPQGAGATITLPPGLHLPPGTVLMKNEQTGQLMFVSGTTQTAATNLVPTPTSAAVAQPGGNFKIQTVPRPTVAVSGQTGQPSVISLAPQTTPTVTATTRPGLPVVASPAQPGVTTTGIQPSPGQPPPLRTSTPLLNTAPRAGITVSQQNSPNLPGGPSPAQSLYLRHPAPPRTPPLSSGGSHPPSPQGHPSNPRTPIHMGPPPPPLVGSPTMGVPSRPPHLMGSPTTMGPPPRTPPIGSPTPMGVPGHAPHLVGSPTTLGGPMHPHPMATTPGVIRPHPMATTTMGGPLRHGMGGAVMDGPRGISSPRRHSPVPGHSRPLTPNTPGAGPPYMTVRRPPFGAGGNPSPGTTQLTPGNPTTHTNNNLMDNVRKCKNFLSTLIKLASNQPADTVKNVKQLIQGLIDGKIEPEHFTSRLQVELKSSPQPYLVPFLKKSLPSLRQALINKQMVIDGVRPPPTTPPATPTTTPGAVTVGVTMAQAMVNKAIPRIRPTVVQPGALPKVVAAAPQTKSLLTTPGGAVQVRGPVPTSIIGVQPGMAATVSSTAGIVQNREKRKYEAIKDDEDFNDVATMGGVNLSEESRNILATNSELMSGQLQSCKDETFLHTIPLQNRINAIVRKHGLDDVPHEVADLLSHATQERLRNILERLALISEHRLEIYKSDKKHESKDEVKSQLKFIEELDKLEKKRHEEAEREVLLRAAKSRSKQEDPEQLKLKEKAKALQQAEMEELRQLEANRTALAAIGPRKKKKTDDAQAGTSTSPGAGAGSGAGSTRTSMLRPRIKRVNLRDLIFLLEQDQGTGRSHLLYRLLLK